jgi:glycosyltransferase involved in cell wall biosynthesis
MKIAFSARGLSIPSGGARRFISSLIPALAEQRGSDELFILYNCKKFLGLAPGCNEILIEGNNKMLWDLLLLPGVLNKLKVDAAIFPKNVVPFHTKYRSFVVIHDLAYFDAKLGAYPVLDTLYMRTMIPRSVRSAAGVFAVSENTKKDIIHYTDCNPSKIVVTYEAADKIYQPISDVSYLSKIRKKYNIPDDFILYVGSLSPRKNIIRLLEAFSRVQNELPHKLVLTGSKSWKDSPVYQTMKKLNLHNRINQLGYVDEQDMPALYNLASAYIYPSLYEGFGLPVLEAMQCGCPVAASNATSIPEVAGDAAILFDPLDIQTMTEAIRSVLTDDRLREELVQSGFRQARKFSWSRCANIMLETVRNSVPNNKSTFATV